MHAPPNGKMLDHAPVVLTRIFILRITNIKPNIPLKRLLVPTGCPKDPWSGEMKELSRLVCQSGILVLDSPIGTFGCWTSLDAGPLWMLDLFGCWTSLDAGPLWMLDLFGCWTSLDAGPLWMLDLFGCWTSLDAGPLWMLDLFGCWTSLDAGPLWMLDLFGCWTSLDAGPLDCSGQWPTLRAVPGGRSQETSISPWWLLTCCLAFVGVFPFQHRLFQ